MEQDPINNDNQQEREIAEDRFKIFCEVLYDIEKEDVPVDLNQGSGPFIMTGSTLEFTPDGFLIFLKKEKINTP